MNHLSRNILRNRHRFSERQIDDFLSNEAGHESPQDRMLGMQQIGLFLELTKVLKEHGIEFINLKGPLLSKRIYGDPTYRYSRDFDILVEPDEVQQTLQVLRKRGYNYPGFKWPKSEKKQGIALHFLNQIEIIHQESGLMIEVHWKLFSTRIAKRKTIEHLFNENFETVEFGGMTMNRLSLEFELFYLIVHGGNHAWFRLKWLVDIHEILHRKEINWETFNRIISQCKAHRQVDICNAMLREYFPDGKLLPQTKTDSHNLGAFAIEQCKQPEGDPHLTRMNTARLTFYRLKLFSRWQNKLDVTKVLTFCKTDLKYEWLPPYKFVYYLFRPVGYVLRAVRFLK